MYKYKPTHRHTLSIIPNWAVVRSEELWTPSQKLGSVKLKSLFEARNLSNTFPYEFECGYGGLLPVGLKSLVRQ
jgi:hypothetical protein